MNPDYATLVRRLLTAAEKADIEGYLECFAPDADYRVGNAAPVTGRDAIRAATAQVAQVVQGVTHDVHDIYSSVGVVMVNADVTYRRRDGKEFRVPCLTIVGFEGDKVRNYQAYVDVTAVFAVSRLDRVMAMSMASSQGRWDQFESFLTDDVLFVVGSAAELREPRQVSDFYRRTQDVLKITGAHMRGMWELGDVVVMEMDVQVQPAAGGKPVVYPSVDTFRFRGDRVCEWRTYPLYPLFIKD